MSTEAQDNAVLKELFAIRLYGVDLHHYTEMVPVVLEEGEDSLPTTTPITQRGELVTREEAEDAWRKLEEKEREHWRAIAQRLLPQLEDDGVTVRARAEAAKTLRIALTVPAHTAYEIPGLRK